MALIKCAACSKEISENAASCPNCGEKPPKKTSRFTWAVLALLIIGAMSQAFRPKPTAPVADTRTVEQIAADEKEVRRRLYAPIARARILIESSSKDAGSLKFQNEFNSDYGSGNDIVCGQVNGKNGFGGYTGFTRFIVDSKTILLDGRDTQKFQAAWKKFCIV